MLVCSAQAGLVATLVGACAMNLVSFCRILQVCCCLAALRHNWQEAVSSRAIAVMCAQEYTAKLGALQAKGDDYDIAAAQVGVEVYSAMSAAVGQ